MRSWIAHGKARRGLRVAVVSTAKYFVPRLLGSFCASHPDIDVALEILNRDGVVARLRENRDDLYIMSMPPEHIDVERHAFLANPLVVIAPERHRLARRAAIRLDELAEERFILRERGSGTRLACTAHFAEQGFDPRVRLELGSNEAIKQAIAGGLGISVLSRHTLALEAGQGPLLVLDVATFPLMRQWYVAYPAGKHLSAVAEAFLAHLLQARA